MSQAQRLTGSHACTSHHCLAHQQACSFHSFSVPLKGAPRKPLPSVRAGSPFARRTLAASQHCWRRVGCTPQASGQSAWLPKKAIYWLFGLSNAPCLCRFTRCSADPSTITALLEARRVYATGLLAIGLAANEACAEAVRNGMAVELAKVEIAALMLWWNHGRPDTGHSSRQLQLWRCIEASCSPHS